VRYRRGVFVAVGEALVLLGGRRSLALPWLQRMGSTKAYLLCREPLRLGPRYLRYSSLFLFYLLRKSLRASPPRHRRSHLPE
jgi:N-acetylglucosaminyldiphosphoundecaprenol N-acetyl-beta-D-mannosaminyltransferase